MRTFRTWPTQRGEPSSIAGLREEGEEFIAWPEFDCRRQAIPLLRARSTGASSAVQSLGPDDELVEQLVGQLSLDHRRHHLLGKPAEALDRSVASAIDQYLGNAHRMQFTEPRNDLLRRAI